jgi:transcriptional regulator with XRE-family HTH domain
MAKPKLRDKAIKLRKQGKSYSQIKKEVNVSKGTLSRWLQDYPLSEKRLRELRDHNPKRIEKFCKTMRAKRQSDFDDFFAKAKKEIGEISDREKLISGFYLYWAEGSKSKRYSVSVSNTDPGVLVFFIEWLELLGVSREDMKVKLHVYQDMDTDKKQEYWKDVLSLPKDQFRPPYTKESNQSSLTYKSQYEHGTCKVTVDGREVAYFVHMGLKYIREQHTQGVDM